MKTLEEQAQDWVSDRDTDIRAILDPIESRNYAIQIQHIDWLRENNQHLVMTGPGHEHYKAIASLVTRAFLAGHKAAQRWIPVSERLPEVTGKYLCIRFQGDSGSDIEFDAQYQGWNIGYGGDRGSELFPTHWMPLPPPPEGEK